MSQRRPARPLAGALIGVISGALAMFLLSTLAAASLPLALVAAGVAAAAGGAASASLLRRGAAGANLAGLSTLAGVVLFAVPLLLSGPGPGLTGTQIVLFGLALAALSAMGGQFSSGR